MGLDFLRRPWTTALLCLALKALSLETGKVEGDTTCAEELLRVGAGRLSKLMRLFQRDPDWMQRTVENERRAWDAFYTVLDRVEAEGRRGSREAESLIRRAGTIVREARIHGE